MYQIVKGWPSEGAIDEKITLATAGTVVAGGIGRIKADGEGELGTYLANGTDANLIPFLCIDVDEVTGEVTGLLGPCMLEVDADHYKTGTAVGDFVSAGIAEDDRGKFEVIAASGDLRPKLGTVIALNATTGIARIYWHGMPGANMTYIHASA